jgi:hypothetical protein
MKTTTQALVEIAKNSPKLFFAPLTGVIQGIKSEFHCNNEAVAVDPLRRTSTLSRQ